MGKNVNRKPLIKKFLAIALISAIIMALSGCIRYSATVTVGSNGELDITLLYAVYDTSSLGGDDSSSSSGLSAEDADKLEEAGWKVKEYAKDSYKGYEISKKGIKAADFEEEMKDADIGFDKFTFTEKKGVYTLEWTFPLTPVKLHLSLMISPLFLSTADT